MISVKPVLFDSIFEKISPMNLCFDSIITFLLWRRAEIGLTLIPKSNRKSSSSFLAKARSNCMDSVNRKDISNENVELQLPLLFQYCLQKLQPNSVLLHPLRGKFEDCRDGSGLCTRTY